MPDSAGVLLRRAPPLAERMAGQLRREIDSGQHKPGGRLPTEREMSEAYGVSRAIVREALGRLKQDGVVVSRQGSGVFVAESAAPVFRLQAVTADDASEIRNLVELLSAVRAAASARAAIRRTPAQLAEITRWYKAIGRAIRDGTPGTEEDIGFHRAIIDASGNPLFRDMLDFLDGRVRQFVRTARFNSRHRGLAQQVQEEHRAMRDAIAARDPDAARRAAEAHLSNALVRLGLDTAS